MLDYAFTDSLPTVDPVAAGFNVSTPGTVSRRAVMLDTRTSRTGILGETVLPPFRPGRAGFPLQPQGIEGMWSRLHGPTPGDDPAYDEPGVMTSNGNGGALPSKPFPWKAFGIGAGVAVGLGALWYFFLR